MNAAGAIPKYDNACAQRSGTFFLHINLRTGWIFFIICVCLRACFCFLEVFPHYCYVYFTCQGNFRFIHMFLFAVTGLHGSTHMSLNLLFSTEATSVSETPSKHTYFMQLDEHIFEIMSKSIINMFMLMSKIFNNFWRETKMFQ